VRRKVEGISGIPGYYIWISGQKKSSAQRF